MNCVKYFIVTIYINYMKFNEWLELREEKDACYYKVKATASVWPSAYASGRLVQCRKKGAKNYGNSKKKKRKKHMREESVQIDEALANPKQYSDAANAAMALMYKGLDVANMSGPEIIEALSSMGKNSPEGVSSVIFAARIKAVVSGVVDPNDFNEGTFNLEKERGLRGWFDRNHGKGWIDCKASKKGNLVPCGRKKTGKGSERKYPACRPTLSACNAQGKKRKKSSKRISWKKSFKEWVDEKNN